MTDQELKDIVAAVVAELEKSGVDFDYKAEPAEDGDLVFVIRGTAPNYQGVTVTWKGLLDIITAQATQAKNDAETAKNTANTILTQVQSKGTEITNFVATSKTEIETQKNESVNAVKSVYQTDFNELKGDLVELADTQKRLIFHKEVSGTALVQRSVNIPKGSYMFHTDGITSTDTDFTKSYVNFYGESGIVKTLSLDRNKEYDSKFTLSDNVISIAFYASNDYSNSIGDTFSFANVKITEDTNLNKRFENVENDLHGIEPEVESGTWENASKVAWNKRLRSTSKYEVKKGSLIEFDAKNLYIEFYIYKSETSTTTIQFSPFATGKGNLIIHFDGFMCFVVKNASGDVISLNDYDCSVTIYNNFRFSYLNNKLSEINTDDIEYNKIRSSNSSFLQKISNGIYMSHLFADKITGEYVTIPWESLFDVRIAKRLGFKVAEGNVHQTSDGKYVVLHGESGKFGWQFKSVDGTSIKDIAVNTVTLDWIKSNVRYKCMYDKYQVAPPSLEEWLTECKICGLIPMVQSVGESLAITDKIMGKDNYIAYAGNRNITSAPILTFTSLSTKEKILAHCKSYGVPFIYSMANPTSFTDEQLTDIVNTLHENGFFIAYAGCYLNESQNQRLRKLGFDFSGSGWQINDFESGNICHLVGDIGFDKFTTTGVADAEKIILTNGNTVIPNADISSQFLSGGSLHITYNGTLHIKMGDYIDEDIISDGTHEMWFSTYFISQAPVFTLTAVGDVTINSIVYKASKF